MLPFSIQLSFLVLFPLWGTFYSESDEIPNDNPLKVQNQIVHIKAAPDNGLDHFCDYRNDNSDFPDTPIIVFFRNERQEKAKWHKHKKVVDQHFQNPPLNRKLTCYQFENCRNKVITMHILQ